MQAMYDHAWQGNVRELNHVVERAVLMAQLTAFKRGRFGLAFSARRFLPGWRR